jgi:hypothetical protein
MSNNNIRKFSHVVHLNVLDQFIIPCYTDNPDRVTLNIIKQTVDKMELTFKISRSLGVRLQNNSFNIRYRTEDSTQNYDDLNTPIKFIDGKATVHVVIEHYFPKDNRTMYTPKENVEYLLNERYSDTIHSSNTFNVFCKMDRSYVFTVSENMLVGNLAYQLCKKFNMKMHKIRLVCGHQLEFDKRISETNVGKDSTIFVLLRASNYMYVAETNLKPENHYCILDDLE